MMQRFDPESFDLDLAQFADGAGLQGTGRAPDDRRVFPIVNRDNGAP